MYDPYQRAFKTHWKLVLLTPITSSELCDSGTRFGAFGTRSRPPCTDHLLPGGPGDWAPRESWAPTDALTSNLGQRPAMWTAHPPSRPDWLLGPWGPLGVGREPTLTRPQKGPSKFPWPNPLGVGVTPQWSHEVVPWPETSICTWPAGELRAEVNLGGLQRLKAGRSTVSPPTSGARDCLFQGLLLPPGPLLPS